MATPTLGQIIALKLKLGIDIIDVEYDDILALALINAEQLIEDYVNFNISETVGAVQTFDLTRIHAAVLPEPKETVVITEVLLNGEIVDPSLYRIGRGCEVQRVDGFVSRDWCNYGDYLEITYNCGWGDDLWPAWADTALIETAAYLFNSVVTDADTASDNDDISKLSIHNIITTQYDTTGDNVRKGSETTVKMIPTEASTLLDLHRYRQVW